MDKSRREILKGFVGATLMGFTGETLRAAVPPTPLTESPINIILPRDYTPPNDNNSSGYSYKLARAALDFLEENFSRSSMPIWKQPFHKVDMEVRVRNIVYWIQLAVEEYRSIYPVDPAWVLAQIMHESYFYEFCVSSAAAVGICQFVRPTAREYDMICAGDLPEHASNLYRKSDFIVKLDVYYELRRERQEYIRSQRHLEKMEIDDVMRRIAENDQSIQQDAIEWNAHLMRKTEYDQRIRESLDQYREFLTANFEGRDIFKEDDLRFLLGFDERVTYKKPIFSMVQMLTKSLRARNGNIITAAAGYNAGLSRTQAHGPYKPFGRIPNFDETVTYISRILINHYEIARRVNS